MTRRVEITSRAERDLRGIDRRVATRIVQAIRRFADTDHGDVTKLRATDRPEWRLRVGQYRVRFAFSSDGTAILILRVLPRGRAYRD